MEYILNEQRDPGAASLDIRPLHAADAPAFRAMRPHAIAGSPSAIWPTHEEEAGRTLEDTEARIRQIQLSVNAENPRALQLYRGLGMQFELLAGAAFTALSWRGSHVICGIQH